jgi:hypothetical protein
LELVVAINRKHRSSSIGTGGRHQSEALVVFNWTQWSPSIGSAGRLQLEPVVAIGRCGQPVHIAAEIGHRAYHIFAHLYPPEVGQAFQAEIWPVY